MKEHFFDVSKAAHVCTSD